MNNFKRIVALLLSLVLSLLLNLTLTAFAESSPQITLSDVSGNPGDSVTVDIEIENNPGIMVMAFSIAYDSDTFEYAGYSKGYLTKYTLKDHPDKSYISFINDETGDKSNNGVMLSLKFKIKDTAKTEKYTISLANLYPEKFGSKLNNSFSSSKQQYIIPTVSEGSITVGKPCEELGHKYSSWTVIKTATCTKTGQKQHICKRCGYKEKQNIPATSHDFETEWTVDKAATPTEDGVMSRHCKNCDAVTDKFNFTYKEVEESENQNTSTENTTSSSADSSSNQSAPNDSSDQTSSSPKAPINNTAGEKNSLSAVENIQDFKENVEPYISIKEENNKEIGESSETNSKTSADSTDNSDNETSSQEETVTDSKSNSVKNNKTLFIILTVCAIIAVGITSILFLKHKKKQ